MEAEEVEVPDQPFVPRLVELRAGDQIRVTRDGPVVHITRVSPGAAYFKTYQESTFEVFDAELGENKEFTKRSSKTSYISPRSSVEMIERGPEPPVKSYWSLPTEEAQKPTPKAPRPELPPVKYKRVNRKR